MTPADLTEPDCVCFNKDNSTVPFEDAYTSLQVSWICERAECQVKYLKENDLEYYQELFDKYEGDIDEMAQDIVDSLGDGLDEGDFCEI